jgi:hypothetical protein
MKRMIIKTMLVSMMCFRITCNYEVRAERMSSEVSGFVWTQTDFTEKTVHPGGRFWMYRPKLKLVEDILYVSNNKGIFSRNLNEENSRFELFALGELGQSIIDFVKNGDKILVIAYASNNHKDSLLFLSVDNGKTFENFTSPDLFQNNPYTGWICEECNAVIQIAQHPKNKDTIALLTHYGISISEDFGLTWRHVMQRYWGGQDWHLGFHPLDGNTLFYTGEQIDHSGVINKSSDGGITWSYWNTMYDGGGDDCVHSIAYHPTNPDILVHSAEGWIRKSTDRGETWNDIEGTRETGMYFFKVLFDNDNPEILYATGGQGGSSMNGADFHLYRSTDSGESWHHVFEHNTNIKWGGTVFDMIQYKNKLFLYLPESGIAELDLGTKTGNVYIKNIGQASLTVFPNPARNILYFDTDLVVSSVEMINLTGQVHQKTAVLNNERQIDISQLNAGIYFAVFHTKELSVTKKIVVVK